MSIRGILEQVETAGAMALEMQQRLGSGDRDYKSDQSVITKADHRIEDFLVEHISARCPDANIITEEADRPFDPGKPQTFAIDPIDGTDVYSQRMPGWCISVGLLDEDLVPIAGIICAPRLDLLLVTDVDGAATLNGSELPSLAAPQPISVRSNLMVTSRIHKQLDLSAYVGKIRSIGSAALHLCYPLIRAAVIGALEGRGAHIWDIAAAHAINRAQGRDLAYLNGEPIDYAPLVDGSIADDIIMSGDQALLDELRHVLRRLS